MPEINRELRRACRALRTRDLVTLLAQEHTDFFELAEVVGRWVWIAFTDRQPREITSRLAELGFHWNNRRQVWQHPCGQLRRLPSSTDPRSRFRTYFPADARRG